MKRRLQIRKVLILGSGGLQIGQAGEFDYSGSQAIKGLKEEGIEVVLVNPNVATVQTDPGMADSTYLLPVTPDVVEDIIDKEKPDGILLGFGGQTALNTGIQLSDAGVFARTGMEVLGTSIQAIRTTEDRQLFKCALETLGLHATRSVHATTVQDARRAAEFIGFPLMLRTGYSLGGLGSGILRSKEELEIAASQALSVSSHIVIEENLTGWKEIEYEVMRDSHDNCMVVCNMENMDPVGVHTGDSIVVAPSQTLTNNEYHQLREYTLRIARAIGIVGEGNVQFALHPITGQYRVIEMNARLSRSSALASKATGYPIATIAAKLSIGYTLPELRNPVTKSTSAFFEPAMDYLAVKIPRWDSQKFPGVDSSIGTEMKSVGEVMALGRSFPECLQKAVRMLAIGKDGLAVEEADPNTISLEPREDRLFQLAAFFFTGGTVEEAHRISRIDPWFLHHIKDVADTWLRYQSGYTLASLTGDDLRLLKQRGFSDAAISLWMKCSEEEVRRIRGEHGVLPAIKQIDTLAGEYPAKTQYLYCTYHGTEHDVSASAHATVLLGSGPYSIGSSVEFDWCSVNALRSLRSRGMSTIMINSNPETVSTDYDESDRLYFEELTEERIRDILEYEKPSGLMLSLGGQIPNTLALRLASRGFPILGTSAASIDAAEDRMKFCELLDRLGIQQPEWTRASDESCVQRFIDTYGYPVIIRPSYVLSGSWMRVVSTTAELHDALESLPARSRAHPVLLSRFVEDAREFELDAVAHNGRILTSVLTEHIERAGTHSGDATVVYPPHTLSHTVQNSSRDIASRIADTLSITGPFNVQFLLEGTHILVLECNLRASRSFPFVSKAAGVNLVDVAVSAYLNSLKNMSQVHSAQPRPACVKVPQFSFRRLKKAVPTTTVEMRSTGEVACFGKTMHEALYRAWKSSDQRVGSKTLLFLPETDIVLFDAIKPLKSLVEAGWTLYTDMKTKRIFSEHTLRSTGVSASLLAASPSSLADNQLPIGISIILSADFPDLRRFMIDTSIPLICNRDLAVELIVALAQISNGVGKLHRLQDTPQSFEYMPANVL